MVGENFRGSFGASRSQPGWSITPESAEIERSGSLRGPQFRPQHAQPFRAGRRTSSQVDEADLAAYPGLILPRFRAALVGNTGRQGPDAWRYRYFSGRWWYWQPPGSWLYWDGARWQAFSPPQ